MTLIGNKSANHIDQRAFRRTSLSAAFILFIVGALFDQSCTATDGSSKRPLASIAVVIILYAVPDVNEASQNADSKGCGP
jgi:hypothetical protein